MAKDSRKLKKKRRVSFSLPEAEEKHEDSPKVQVSIHDEASYDDEVETMDVEGSNGLAKTDSSDESSDEAASHESEAESDAEMTAPREANGRPKQSESDSESASDSDDCASNSDENVSSSDSADESTSEDENDEADTPQNDPEAGQAPPSVSSFGEMSLDPRVERAIERVGWRKPTPVQSAVVPAALSGRDVLVSAPTGSGKTGAYAIPIVQHICRAKSLERSGTKVVVLVPTRELVHQVTGVLKALCRYIGGVQVAAVMSRKKGNTKKNQGAKGGPAKQAHGQQASEALTFTQSADIMVGTPASIVNAAGTEQKSALSEVQFVVVDEADLVLSYGYESDAKAALAKIPPTAQSMLLSATLEADGMASFRKVVLRRPLTIKVTTDGDMKDGDPTGASHYFARLKNHKDRYLVAYAMLRLNVVCGKVLLFVNHVNSAFRLKLFLDQFKVKSAVLNSELPANSRMHCVSQFNAGVFDILIATDESKDDEALVGKKKKSGSKKTDCKKRKVDADEEFGLSRGVDFQDVAAVFNFDVPETVASYTHRAGRTARAGRSGTVMSLVCSDKDQSRVAEMGRELGVHIGPLAFRMDQIEAFRYRVEDCLRMVTDAAVNGARLADVQREIVNSEHLQDYFEDNPQDLDALRHTLSLAKNIPEHLAHIPSYLLPVALRGSVTKDPRGSKFRTKRKRGPSKRSLKKKSAGDPLKTFSNKGLAGSSRQRFQERHGIKKRQKSNPGQMMKKRRRVY
ncbi:unnamed protein product [Chondrus crispus]|uniref:RNA helicase n=1 Tax=Chondrus crispus TaxID=2769 RepID=R7Q612_CHOCR|nr:unnamed protein product [Chondrus crispus]CDF33283.1 unnamed protein product [Chondrus crispus]|eukprot:XP_005713086.1 unnamed protein product [Chondrus crispus]